MPFDVRRFRPNLLVETPDERPFGEDAWVGRSLSCGGQPESARIGVTMRDRRVMVNLDPGHGGRRSTPPQDDGAAQRGLRRRVRRTGADRHYLRWRQALRAGESESSCELDADIAASRVGLPPLRRGRARGGHRCRAESGLAVSCATARLPLEDSRGARSTLTRAATAARHLREGQVRSAARSQHGVRHTASSRRQEAPRHRVDRGRLRLGVDSFDMGAGAAHQRPERTRLPRGGPRRDAAVVARVQRQSGDREYFLLGEVDDVLAAIDFVRKRADVDPKRVYLGGHSTGATLALLVAASQPPVRAVFGVGPIDRIRMTGRPTPRSTTPTTTSWRCAARRPG